MLHQYAPHHEFVTPGWLLSILNRFFLARVTARASVSAGIGCSFLQNALDELFLLPAGGEGLERFVIPECSDYRDGFRAGISVALVINIALLVAVVSVAAAT